MSVNKAIREELPEGSLVFDNSAYDNSIIGYTTDDRVVYDYDKMIEELMQDEGITESEAIDWIDFNTIRSIPYAGEYSPIVMYAVGEYNMREKENKK